MTTSPQQVPGNAWELTLDPFPWYRAQRERDPVSHAVADGLWMVFGYVDVQRALTDHHEFSSQFGNLSILNTDPPRHRQLRNLVTEAFTPRTVEALRPRISAIVEGLLDQVHASGKMDLIADLAVPLPVTVIAELLGIPTEDRDRFKRWSDAVVTGGGAGQASGEMAGYFFRLIEQRRRSPRQDLISDLLAARIDGKALSQADLYGFCVLLLVAGNETTTNLIGNAILCLDEHPDARAQLIADPTLLPSAIEEVLRYRSPIQSMFRITRTDVDLGGRSIPRGAHVMAWIGSANRDPAQFPDPDRFDVRRTPNRHLAFGHGIHFCLGAPLARLEATIALQAVLRRLPRLAVDRSVRLERVASDVVFGVRGLPVTWAPA
jgi:cytochrome P450